MTGMPTAVLATVSVLTQRGEGHVRRQAYKLARSFLPHVLELACKRGGLMGLAITAAALGGTAWHGYKPQPVGQLADSAIRHVCFIHKCDYTPWPVVLKLGMGSSWSSTSASIAVSVLVPPL